MQKLTKFKVTFDLFTVCVFFIQQQIVNYITYILRLFLKFRAKLDIVLVTAQKSKHPQILAATPYWPDEYP